MLESTSLLQATSTSNAIPFGEAPVKTAELAGLEEQLFQGALLEAGKEGEMQTLLIEAEIENQAACLSSYEMCSTLSFLSAIGVIAPPDSLQAQGFAPMTEQAISDQDSLIQTILEKPYSGYQLQLAGADVGYESVEAIDMDADSDLDQLISSLLVGKNQNKTGQDAMADLSWNHFNQEVLIGMDGADNDLSGFTFNGESLKGQTASKAELEMEKVGEEAAKALTPLLSEKVTADGEMAGALTEKSSVSDHFQISQAVTSSREPAMEASSVRSTRAEWRPDQQIAEYEIVKQVAQKLSLQKISHNGTDNIRLDLEPKELGPLKIDISIHKNLISADILTQNATVREILDKNQTLLRDTLSNMGFSVEHFSVNVGDFGGFNRFLGREQPNNEFGTDIAFKNRSGSNSMADLGFETENSFLLDGDEDRWISVYV